MSNTNQMRFALLVDEKENDKLNFRVEEDILSITSDEENLMPQHLHGSHIEDIVQVCAILHLTWTIVSENGIVTMKVYF